MNDIVTIVGENTVIKGALQGDEDLTIFGRVEGTINLSRTLIIEASGIVAADIDVQDAIVSGVVVGNITASNSVQITEEGRMVGDLSSPRVIIVDGASFKGHVDMGDLEAPVGERLPATRSPSTPRASGPAVSEERQAVPTRRPAASKPAATKAVPKPAPRKAKPAPKRAPAKAPKKVAKKAVKKSAKARRKPPRPPSVPKGKRKVKRRR